MIIDKTIKKWVKENVVLDKKMIDVYENPQKYVRDREIKSFNDVHEKHEPNKKFKGKFIGGIE